MPADVVRRIEAVAVRADPAAKVGDRSDQTNRVGRAYWRRRPDQAIASLATTVAIVATHRLRIARDGAATRPLETSCPLCVAVLSPTLRC
jgi:hypothetical protein